MESLNNKKFEVLSNDELNQIEGGKWITHQYAYRDGTTTTIAERVGFISGEHKEWGQPVMD